MMVNGGRESVGLSKVGKLNGERNGSRKSVTFARRAFT